MRSRFFLGLFLMAMVVLGPSFVAAHCEIPCGIYDDSLRIKLLDEHVSTIEKSMNQILGLSGQTPMNHNQLARWVMNKEDHAKAFQDIVTQYFMTQRIKFDTPKYEQKVTLLHKMLVYAMKCKQTTDLKHIETLRSLIKEFSNLYFKTGNK